MSQKRNKRQRKLAWFRVNIFRAKQNDDESLVEVLEKKRAKIKQLPILPDDKTAA